MNHLTPQQARSLLVQAIAEGNTFVLVQRGGYTQVGLSADGQTVNITAAVCLAYSLPHQGQSIIGSKEQVAKLLPMVAAKKATPKPEPVITPVPQRAKSVDEMSNEELIAYIAANPDMVSAPRSH